MKLEGNKTGRKWKPRHAAVMKCATRHQIGKAKLAQSYQVPTRRLSHSQKKKKKNKTFK